LSEAKAMLTGRPIAHHRHEGSRSLLKNGAPFSGLLQRFESDSLFSSWPGIARSKNGVAFACLCPSHPRFSSLLVGKDVDARHKAGHDD
jgi:hypothetical protein